MPLHRPLVLAVLLAGAAPPVLTGLAAQTLADRIEQLFTFGTCGQPLCLDGSALVGHGNHFIPATTSSAGSIISFIETSIGTAVSNLPVSAASSGVTFKFVGGVPVKTSTSAGPIFAERAQTLGKGRFFIGANVTQQAFERLRGVRLDNLHFNFGHQDIPPAPDSLGDPSFENDLVSVSMVMNLDLLVATGFMTWGIVDGVDVSLAVPFVHTSLSGNSVAQITPFGSGASTPHYFGTDVNGNPILAAVSSTDGSASGIGDIAGRLKVNVFQSQKVGVAVLADARFPTGDDANLLGAGAFSGRGLGIVSMRFGAFSPHANLGYVFRDDSLANNGVLTTFGFDHLLAPWATLAVDFIGEWQVGDSKITVPQPIVYAAPFARVVPATAIPEQKDDQMATSIGMKFVTPSGMTFVANALFPLRDSGVQPNTIWTAGIEYNF